ncbi:MULTISPECIES: hypothetical protein [unclassified Pseudomonas]|uniref:hypothetical protein n=1 Tax=unclassified Pseudomonas TaxID=196821 RepID=UPI002449777B|nr:MULTISPECIES: hypothetical protein [unclassified Pseudomonas]MDG9931027.1 hypothetical protein [Pseudomonas sp. GD04042]MDH0485381.1 hypothetical protein [Pseudomonas sp. GD04015]MDH0605072.1 hypothetical protein [Pseudomonas sp. GD03869]
MTKVEFLECLGFPDKWLELGLYPDELFSLQLAEHRPEYVSSAEHTRNGAFSWWLHNDPSSELLKQLALLSRLDPDRHLAVDAQARIRESRSYTAEVEKALAGSSV